MADYIYTMELRLTPSQQKGVTLVQDIARNAGMNVYLTGGAVRDIITGFPIRDLDFTVQGNPLKLQKEFERSGAVIGGADDYFGTLYLTLPAVFAPRSAAPVWSAMKRRASRLWSRQPRSSKICGAGTSQ